MSEILKAFNQASETYDKYAIIQRRVAKKLAPLLLPLSPAPQTILEIGCGTGFLTGLIHPQQPQALYIATDIAPAMVDMCRRKVGEEGVTYAVMDGEDLTLNKPVDWIVSNLTFQWFQSLESSLESLWSQTSTLAFTTLVDGTFSEWRQLYYEAGLRDRVQPMISAYDLYCLCQRLGPKKMTVNIAQEREHHSTSGAFIRYLKSIGACTPHLPDCQRGGGTPSMLPAMPPEGLDVTYQIAYCVLQR